MLEEHGIHLIWFDSLGAKSSSIAVETSRGVVVIDPGAAAMQPGYPLPDEEKIMLRRKAKQAIYEWLKKAVIVIVTHYHYDHHFVPGDPEFPEENPLAGKTIYAKNPNKYINESQWGRARIFLEALLGFYNISLENYLIEPLETSFPDPVDELEISLRRDFGDYTKRRRELLEKGRRWFEKLSKELWAKKKWVTEIQLSDGTRILWGENRVIECGDTRIKILGPWFHGLEYDRTGWITPVIIEKNNWKLFYTSDVMGPIIEDYAYYIINEKPDAIILDGPPTYLFPYMFNKINLNRAIENTIEIIKSHPQLIIYDHHLLREKRWRERVKQVFQAAEKEGVKLLTAAEYLGKKPLIDTVASK
ncbi:MBL fold metallo-hydrolase [Desulfurococcaceae archaeon MEX13E-LK6-19]|nr:MBL fold metallo-hydrolase [Desulfurococcaceae archaeon MEX13E-LK6-19]